MLTQENHQRLRNTRPVSFMLSDFCQHFRHTKEASNNRDKFFLILIKAWDTQVQPKNLGGACYRFKINIK